MCCHYVLFHYSRVYYSILCISERGKDSSHQAEAGWTRRHERDRHKSLQARSAETVLHRCWLSDRRGNIGQCYRWGYFHLYKILPCFRFWCWVFRDVLIISPHTSKVRPPRTSSCIRAIHLGPNVLFNRSRWLSLRFAFKSNVFPVLFVVSIEGYVLACFFTMHSMSRWSDRSTQLSTVATPQRGNNRRWNIQWLYLHNLKEW